MNEVAADLTRVRGSRQIPDVVVRDYAGAVVRTPEGLKLLERGCDETAVELGLYEGGAASGERSCPCGSRRVAGRSLAAPRARAADSQAAPALSVVEGRSQSAE